MKWNKIINGIFTVYIFFLIVLVVIKFDFHKGYLHRIERILCDRESVFWNFNLYPFKTITAYINGYREGYDSLDSIIYNIVGNIAAYVPFGFLLPLVHVKYSNFKLCAKFGMVFIVLSELFQFITMLGYFDIDDIILNTSGFILGYSIYVVAEKLRLFSLLKIN